MNLLIFGLVVALCGAVFAAIGIWRDLRAEKNSVGLVNEQNQTLFGVLTALFAVVSAAVGFMSAPVGTQILWLTLGFFTGAFIFVFVATLVANKLNNAFKNRKREQAKVNDEPPPS